MNEFQEAEVNVLLDLFRGQLSSDYEASLSNEELANYFEERLLRLVSITNLEAEVDSVDEQCELLEHPGFEIKDGVCRIEHNGLEFDFSGTDLTLDALIDRIVEESYSAGVEAGKDEQNKQLRELIGL